MAERKGARKISEINWREGLPEHFIRADRYYVDVLRKNPDWMQTHLGKHVAIMNEQVVGEEPKFHALATQGQAEHGYGHLFMPLVTKRHPRVIKLGT